MSDLTKPQIEALRKMEEMGAIYAGKRLGNASTFNALVRRGLADKIGIYGPFRLTASGFTALRTALSNSERTDG